MVFNGHNATQLEEWLVDIETAANLTVKSRTKLVQVMSKGLTCTLITEAITPGKSWDDTKDLLQLKYVTLIFTLPYPILWRSSKRKRNLSPHTYTILKGKPRDVILQITLQP